MRTTKSVGCVAIAAICAVGATAAEPACRLWYDRPAEDSAVGWNQQSLPIGNGWFGANVFGLVTRDRIQVTHNGVCSQDRQKGWPALTDALEIRLETAHGDASGYSRGLDLDTATAWVRYASDGVVYTREYFASYPSRALVMRLTASKPKALDFTLRAVAPFLRPFGAKVGKALKGRTAAFVTTADEIEVFQRLEKYGIDFDSRFRVQTDGRCARSGEGVLRVTGATEATVLFVCESNYALKPETFREPFRACGADPRPQTKSLLAAAAQKGYGVLRDEHVRDVRGLLGRADVDLGSDPSERERTTDALVGDAREGRPGAFLHELMFRYGRYLLMSCSRKGTLPANLQGVWNAAEEPFCGSGYWFNIDIQACYSSSFVCNLAECFEPYADLIDAFRPVTRPEALAYLRRYAPANVPGPDESADLWSVGTAVWLFDGEWVPQKHSGPGNCGFTTQLLADWWDFTRDEQVLRDRVWPTVHGVTDFLTRCVVETNGLYLSAFSASPEQRDSRAKRDARGKFPHYQTVGCAYDQQMIWENARNFLSFADRLGTNDAVVARARAQIDRYDPVQVGASGQIKEYREEEKYGEIGQYDHRHISQLVGLMPGTSITRRHPEWMRAARYSLVERTDDAWFPAGVCHRLLAWARLFDGDHALKVANLLLGKYTYGNLWSKCDVSEPPGGIFQAEGPLSYPACVAEMLIQSHEGFIELLPALPKAWSAKGSFRGLCARGAFVVDCAWRDGRPTRVSVRSLKGAAPDVRFAGRPFADYELIK